jgi:hypothetical protein
MTKPVSEKQIAFLSTLASERIHEFAIDFATLTSGEASNLITSLLASPRKVGGSVERVSEEGMYRNAEGDIFRVQRSRESGNLYAKKLDILDGGFIYVQGAIRLIKPSDRLSVEEAKALGVQYGFCIVCGILLTDPKSVEQGIGPICIKRV